MPKPPFPHSAQIVAKTLKDWQNIDYNSLMLESDWPKSQSMILSFGSDVDEGPKYILEFWKNGIEKYLCYPKGFEDDVSPSDKLKLGEKLIAPYILWREKKEEKAEKLRLREKQREHAKKLKAFLAS